MKRAGATLCIVAAVIFSTAFVASGQEKQKPSEPQQTLTVSPDGQFLIDENGKKIKQYLKSAKAFVPMTAKDKSGVEFDPANPDKVNKTTCWPCHCHKECNRWDENGHCNLWIRTCDICC